MTTSVATWVCRESRFLAYSWPSAVLLAPTRPSTEPHAPETRSRATELGFKRCLQTFPSDCAKLSFISIPATREVVCQVSKSHMHIILPFTLYPRPPQIGVPSSLSWLDKPWWLFSKTPNRPQPTVSSEAVQLYIASISKATISIMDKASPLFHHAAAADLPLWENLNPSFSAIWGVPLWTTEPKSEPLESAVGPFGQLEKGLRVFTAHAAVI
jgi:hypothetical protein